MEPQADVTGRICTAILQAAGVAVPSWAGTAARPHC